MNKIINNKNTITLLNHIGLTNKAIKDLMKIYSEINLLWKLEKSDFYKIKNISKEAKNRMVNKFNYKNLVDLLERLKDLNIKVTTILDENYPEKLKLIDDRPKVLYVLGEDIKEEFSIAIVGSRRYTDYGSWACKKITRDLVDLRIPIISGMARGIDGIAHKEALDRKGYTIAVLGSGINIVYPKRNKHLYDSIRSKGTIISEYPLDTPPRPYNFPRRNRIISGLSDSIIVIEAKEKSGSLITANLALEQGKDVYALPGNINSIFSSGTNKLIQDGAIPYLSIKDLIMENPFLAKSYKEEKLREKLNYNFSKTEKKILSVLNEGPVHSDKIVYKTGIDVSTVNTLLIGLELKGIIEEVTNNIFTIC